MYQIIVMLKIVLGRRANVQVPPAQVRSNLAKSTAAIWLRYISDYTGTNPVQPLPAADNWSRRYTTRATTTLLDWPIQMLQGGERET